MFCAAPPPVAVRGQYLRLSPSFPPKRTLVTSSVFTSLSSVIPAKAGIHPAYTPVVHEETPLIPRPSELRKGLADGCLL